MNEMMRSEGITPDLLFKAVSRRDEGAVKQILVTLREMNVCWVDVRHRKTNDSALHIAVRIESLPLVKALCESCHSLGQVGKDECNDCKMIIEISNNLGKKALHEAAQLCNIPIMEYLLNQGANVDGLKAADWTPLMLVCVKNGTNTAKAAQLLLERGANPLITNKDGWTPLHLACRTGLLDTVRILLSYSAEAAERTSLNLRTPLHIASLHGHKAIVEELLNAGCFVDPTDACGLTPLHEAVRGGHIALFRYLKSRGAAIGKTDKMGLTCMHIAAASARYEILEILVEEFGIYVDEPTENDRLTPLHCAVRAGHTNTVRTLINLGANPEIEDSKGRQGVDFCHGFDTEEMIVVLTTPIN